MDLELFIITDKITKKDQLTYPHQFKSTRTETKVDFEFVALSGLAPDGGLYLPTSLPPKLTLESLVDLPFQERMIRIMEDLLPSRISDPVHLKSIIDKVRMIISDLGYRSWNYAAARFRRYLIFYLE